MRSPLGIKLYFFGASIEKNIIFAAVYALPNENRSACTALRKERLLNASL